MRKLCVQSPALILALVLLAAVPAFSAVTTFDNRTTWESALLGRRDVDFNTWTPAALQASVTFGTAPDTVLFTPIAGMLSSFPQAYSSSCSGRCLWNYTDDPAPASRGIAAVFAEATISALAFNLFTVNNPGQQVTVRIFENASVTPTYSDVVTPNGVHAAPAFFGFTSDSVISRIELWTSNTAGINGQVVIDNFSWGQAVSAPPPDPGGGGAETPETATLGYVGVGIIALALGTRRKRARLARQSSR